MMGSKKQASNLTLIFIKILFFIYGIAILKGKILRNLNDLKWRDCLVFTLLDEQHMNIIESLHLMLIGSL